ncbi:MAG: hypothetical protein VKO64_10380 [Candidatus Sericytochromatia bacterium]|nr:hypothetical protein [Candidatus Sericytochromatia bacterium]
MTPTRRVIVGIGSLLLAACAANTGAESSTALTTSLRSVSYTLPQLSTESMDKAQEADRALSAFQDVNSASNFTMPMGNNFTMPMGNNFTMPMGNNFTMPMGNNFTMPMGNNRRVQAVALNGVHERFGFLPFPADIAMSADSSSSALPAEGTTHEAELAGTGFVATKRLRRVAAAVETYEDLLDYATASVDLGSSSVVVTGEHKLTLSGTGWTADTTKRPALILGVHARPAATTRKIEEVVLRKDGSAVAEVTVDQSAFAPYQVPFLKDAPAVQLPGAVSVAGRLSQPTTGGRTLAFDLAAKADLDRMTLMIEGWLRDCDTADGCTPTAAATTTGQAGEIRETLEFDLQGAQSRLTFLKVPQTGRYGFKVTMRYDYAAQLARNLPGTSELTGEVVLVDDKGSLVPGGKLADISSDSDGNPVLTRLDGKKVPWKL